MFSHFHPRESNPGIIDKSKYTHGKHVVFLMGLSFSQADSRPNLVHRVTIATIIPPVTFVQDLHKHLCSIETTSLSVAFHH
jgi:hypothetical protein